MVSFNIEEDINMLKKERLVKIAQKVNQNGIITIQEIMDELGVSDMTARRDLDELEKSGKLLRVHGGAQSLSFSMDHELSRFKLKKKRELPIKLQLSFQKVNPYF